MSDPNFLDIREVKDGAVVLSIEFSCGSGHVLDTLSLDSEGRIDGMRLADICEKPCTRCGEYSDFNFTTTGHNQSKEDQPKRLEWQNLLREVLNRGDLKNPTQETRSMIQDLLNGRNLKLRFRIESTPA